MSQRRPMRGLLLAVVLAAGALGLALAGVVLILAAGWGDDETVCLPGQTPLREIGTTRGRICLDAGRPVPDGYTTFPPGQTPTLQSEDTMTTLPPGETPLPDGPRTP